MLNPDFSDRTYTAEVIRLRSESADVLNALSRITHGPRRELEGEEPDSPAFRVLHAYIPSKRQYHRTPRLVVSEAGDRIEVPRRIKIGKTESFLYDVLIAQARRHIVLAVPFHDLAEEFFVRADDALAGTGTRYEKLDITALIMELGSRGVVDVPLASSNQKLAISVTRCHLAYSDRDGRNRDLQQIRVTGANLGTTSQYQILIEPVLKGNDPTYHVTPIVVGFALGVDGVRKSGATTDRHGNFKVWISPGIRRLTRLFSLIRALEALENVTTTTSNIPILQSGTIREAEG